MDAVSSSVEGPREQASRLLESKDLRQLVKLLSDLKSPNNAHKFQAATRINYCTNRFPGALSLALLRILQYSPHLQTQVQSANLLQRILTRRESHIWPNLPEDEQTNLRNGFLSCYQQENSRPITHIACSLVGEIAVKIFESDEEWPELIGLLLQSLQSNSLKLQENALLVFGYLRKYGRFIIVNVLMPHVEILHSVFLKTLTSSSLDVRIAAFQAVMALTRLFLYSNCSIWFHQLVTEMVISVFEMLNNSQEDSAQRGLAVLVVLAMREPLVFSSYLNNMVGSLLSIAEYQGLQEETKQYAMQFSIVLAEARNEAPGIMRNMSQQNLVRLISIPMKVLTGIEDDPSWHDMRIEERENAGKSIIYNKGMEWLSRLSIALGGKTVVPIAFELLPEYFNAPDWQKHHAGITTLSVIAKGCLKVIIKHLEEVLIMILNSFEDHHPRVRWAAFNAIMQLSKDLSPEIRVQYHHMVLPALILAIKENQNTRVQDNEKTAEERSTAFCIVDDILQKLEGAIIRHCDTCLPYLLKACNEENPKVRQIAARGIRVYAEFGGSEFKLFAQGVVSSLNAVIKHRDMLHSDNEKAYYIAVSALGKLCEFHCDSINAAQVFPTWLSLLPITNHATAAKIVHEQLCSIVEKSEEDLLGPYNKNLPKIISIFAEVLSLNNSLATAQTVSRMKNLLRRFQLKNPLTMKAICSSLSTRLQELLETILSS